MPSRKNFWRLRRYSNKKFFSLCASYAVEMCHFDGAARARGAENRRKPVRYLADKCHEKCEVDRFLHTLTYKYRLTTALLTRHFACAFTTSAPAAPAPPPPPGRPHHGPPTQLPPRFPPPEKASYRAETEKTANPPFFRPKKRRVRRFSRRKNDGFDFGQIRVRIRTSQYGP